MSAEFQVNIKFQSELDIGGRETCLTNWDLVGEWPWGFSDFISKII